MKRMKRWTALMLVLCLLVIPVPAQAAGASNLTFKLNDDGLSYYVSDCDTSASGSLEIPASFNGKPVTAIGRDAFFNCVSLTDISIPDSVTSIGNGAFTYCYSLTSITIPDSVTSIGEFLFTGCSDLQYNIYDNSKYLGNAENPYVVLVNTMNQNVTSCQIHLDTKVIGAYAFYYCESLTNITIPDSVISIGNKAFYSCSSLTKIVVDDNNSRYSSDSSGILFDKNKTKLIKAPGGLSGSYTIPDSVTSIGDDAFGCCYSLTSITIPDGVISIGSGAFHSCYSLTSIKIPDSVTGIDDLAFAFCKGLTSVTIPNRITSIGDYAFRSCTSLTNITIPDSVTSIDIAAFLGCSSLSTVYYEGTEAQKNSIIIASDNDELINAEWKYKTSEETERTFADVSTTSWQYKAVNYAVENGLMAGKGTDKDGKIKFDPNNSITRAEFVQVLYNAESKPSVAIANKFPDVKNEWYKNAVLWANSQNIANGMGDGNFGVGKNITRQDLALMLYKYAKLKDADLTATAGKSSQYADGSKVSGYARQAMDWAVTQGVMSGKGASGAPASQLRLDPAGTATRAECAAMLKNYMEAQDAPDTPDTPAMTAILSGVEADSIQYYNCKESGNFAVIEKDGKYGIIGYDGELVLPITHNKITRGFGFRYEWLIIGKDYMHIDKTGQLQEGYPDGGGVEPSAYWYKDGLVVLNYSMRDIMTLEEYLNSPYSGGLKEPGLVIEQRKWNSDKIFPARKMTGYTNSGYWQEPIYDKVEIALMDMNTYELISDFVYEGFDDHNGVSEGLLAVKKNGKWGFVNEEGTVVIDFLYEPYESYTSYGKTYEYAYTAVNGYVTVKKDGKWGLIDKEGNVVVEIAYDGISQVNPDGMFWLKENGSWTLYQLGA